ncbi:hypothetical protein FRC09_008826 [Ceratobasidium sp. 395]|nr:hypothetical protein FRC09_008826 [Ceratobasidium sp. 395]
MVDGDILIHAGDFSSFTSGFRSSLEWIKGLNHPQKILIAGNHEYNLDNRCIDHIYARDSAIRAELAEDRAMLKDESATEANLTYLEAESAVINGGPSKKDWEVYGSPYTPEYGTMGFFYVKKEAEGKLATTKL